MAEVELEIKHKKRVVKRVDVFHVFTTIILVLSAIVILYPILHFLACSFNNYNLTRGETIELWPHQWTLQYYKKIFFDAKNVRQGAVITVARTLLGTVTSLFATALLAFILSRKKFMFKKGLSLFWVLTMYLNAGLIPYMLLYRYMHLDRSFWVYIIPGMVNVLYVIVIRTYMKGISDSLEEAAQLEGAGYLKIFWSVISPVCKPVYAAVAFFIATTQWNSWFDTMIYNRLDPQYTTLQYEVMKAWDTVAAYYSVPPKGGEGETMNVKYALVIVTMLPVVVVYPFLQKYFVTGVTVRGIKE